MGFYRGDQTTLFLSVRVQPGAKVDTVLDCAPDAEYVKIRVKAKAESNKANEAVLQLLANIFGIRQIQIEVFKGGHCRQKILRLQNLTPIQWQTFQTWAKARACEQLSLLF